MGENVAFCCTVHRDVFSVHKPRDIFNNETRCTARTTTDPGRFQQSGLRNTSELTVRHGTRSKSTMQCTVATNLYRRGATLPGPYFAQKGALERPRQGLRSNACFGATTCSCGDCERVLQSCCFVHDCTVGNLLPQGVLRTQFRVQGCAGKDTTAP